MAYATMTPAQQMRARILSSLHLTEQQIAQMDPKQREAVEKQIADTIKKQVMGADGGQTGVLADVKA